MCRLILLSAECVVLIWLIGTILITIHEAGHVIAMRRYRVPIEHIQIGWGAILRMRFAGLPIALGAVPGVGWCKGPYEDLPARQRLIVEVAGPLASLLGALPFYAWPTGAPGHWIASMIAGASVATAVINLIPLLPFDGGQILVDLLEMSGHRLGLGGRKASAVMGYAVMAMIIAASLIR